MWDNNIHNRALKIKSILGFLEKPFWKLLKHHKNDELIVLNYHSTPIKFINEFENQIKFFLKNFSIITPDDVPKFYSNQKVGADNKPKLLITFDDGLLNNKYAVDVLNKYSLKGLFFVVPNFIDSDDQKNYYLENIREEINPHIDSKPEDFSALSWDELKTMEKAGHRIESHSLSHVMNAQNDSEERQEQELSESKDIIESKLGKKIIAFCAPRNSLRSLNATGVLHLKRNYNYFYSTFAGSNSMNKEPLFIKRSNVECFWPLGSVKFAMGMMEKKRYADQRKRFSELLAKVIESDTH